MKKETYLSVSSQAEQKDGSKKLGFYSLVSNKTNQNLSRQDLIDIIQSLEIAVNDELVDIEYNSVINHALLELSSRIGEKD